MKNRSTAPVTILVLITTALSHAAMAADEPAPSPGALLYKEYCAQCHDRPQGRVPSREALGHRTSEEIVQAMTSGVMRSQSGGLAIIEMDSIATFLTGKPLAAGSTRGPEQNLCTHASEAMNLDGPRWNGWGRDTDNARYQPEPGLKTQDVSRLKVKWAFGYRGSSVYGQPIVMGGRLYLTSISGRVYSLDARSGCVYWTYDAAAGTRTAISVGALPNTTPAKYAAFLGDDAANVYALDAENGTLIWKVKVDDHPMTRLSGAPTLFGDRLYVPVSSLEEVVAGNTAYSCCTFRGSVLAIDIRTGKVLWKSYLVGEPRPYRKNSIGTQLYGPAGTAVWSAPTVDAKRQLIYVGTGNSYTSVANNMADAIVALDMGNGAIRWVNQVTPEDNWIVGCAASRDTSCPFGTCQAAGEANCPDPVGGDHDVGNSPILRTLADGRQVILAGQKSGVVYAVDPDQRGKVVWQTRVGQGSALGGIEWGPAADRNFIYVAISDVFHRPGRTSGGLTALDIASGKKVWHTAAPEPICAWGKRACSAAQSQAVTVIPEVVFSGSQDGHLRGYSTRDGTIIWDVDTARAYPTVNGVEASGGSLDHAGAIVVSGTLYVNSGYGRIVGQPGNVLLAFTIDGK